ncbi:hypothetical protein [Gluconacetobacter sp.]
MTDMDASDDALFGLTTVEARHVVWNFGTDGLEPIFRDRNVV